MRQTRYRLFALFAALVLCWLALFLTQWLFSESEFKVWKYVLRSVVLLLALLVGLKFFLSTEKLITKAWSKNTIRLLASVYAVLIVLEIIFSWLPISCGGAETLVSKNWFNFFWSENELGYRDEPPYAVDRKEVPNVFILGDSYVAGHGLRDPGSRFSKLLSNSVQSRWDVFNLGVCGADTKEELGFLKSYPLKPDALVLCHTNNDIYTVADKKEIMAILGLDKQHMSYMRRFKPYRMFLFANSFALNFIDFSIKNILRERYLRGLASGLSSFGDFLFSDKAKGIEMCYYQNDSLMSLHRKELDHVIDYARAINVPLLVVLFPKINEEVIAYTDSTANKPLQRYLEGKGVSVINLTESIQKISPAQRMVSRFDPHPGVIAQGVVARLIEGRIRQWEKRKR